MKKVTIEPMLVRHFSFFLSFFIYVPILLLGNIFRSIPSKAILLNLFVLFKVEHRPIGSFGDKGECYKHRMYVL